MTVSNAQGEYEQLEKERVEDDLRLANGASGKRDLEGGEEEEQEDGPVGKKVKLDNGNNGQTEEDVEMEMDMEDEDDEDGECFSPLRFSKAGVGTDPTDNEDHIEI